MTNTEKKRTLGCDVAAYALPRFDLIKSLGGGDCVMVKEKSNNELHDDSKSST